MAIQPAPRRADPLGRVLLWGLILLAILVIAGVSMLSGAWRGLAALDPSLQWLGIAGLMTLFLGIVGLNVNGRWLGVLIDGLYKMSLSRLQITLWTILTLSAYLMVALTRIFGGLGTGALQITFPQELILAMGISAASFAGSTLIQSSKQQKSVDIEAKDAALTRLKQKMDDAEKQRSDAKDQLESAGIEKTRLEGELAGAAADDKKMIETRLDSVKRKQAQAVLNFELAEATFRGAEKAYNDALDEYKKATTEAEGVLHKNTDGSQASWVDIFRGDEIGNYKLIEMGKVQMFFFTIIVVLTYAAAVNGLLHAGAGVLGNPQGVEFPAFSNSLNTLLGISHGAYLSVKTVDHTKTA